jgi:hypothetical protein
LGNIFVIKNKETDEVLDKLLLEIQSTHGCEAGFSGVDFKG